MGAVAELQLKVLFWKPVFRDATGGTSCSKTSVFQTVVGWFSLSQKTEKRQPMKVLCESVGVLRKEARCFCPS